MTAPGLRVLITANVSSEDRAAFHAAADKVFGSLEGAWTVSLRPATTLDQAEPVLAVRLVGPTSIAAAQIAVSDLASPLLETRLRELHPSR